MPLPIERQIMSDRRQQADLDARHSPANREGTLGAQGGHYREGAAPAGRSWRRTT